MSTPLSNTQFLRLLENAFSQASVDHSRRCRCLNRPCTPRLTDALEHVGCGSRIFEHATTLGDIRDLAEVVLTHLTTLEEVGFCFRPDCAVKRHYYTLNDKYVELHLRAVRLPPRSYAEVVIG